MSRSIRRRSFSMRVFCTYLALIVIASFAGVGYATPGAESVSPSVENTVSAPPPGGDVVVPEEPEEVPVNDDGGDADVPAEEPAIEESPVEALVAEEPPVEVPAAKAGAEVPAEVEIAVTPAVAPTMASTEQGIVPVYISDWKTHSCSYPEFKIDSSDWHNGTYFTDSEGHTLPGGASITLSNATNFKFDFAANGVLIHHVVVKAGTGALVYNYDPNGISADKWLYSVYKEIETACDYRDISHVSFCYSQTPSHGHVIVRKFDDKNANQTRDGGEDWLTGFVFLLERGDGENGPWTYVDRQTTAGANGQADFDNLTAGWYRMTEELTAAQIAAGWVPTGANPVVFYHTGEVNGSDAGVQTKWFGNRVIPKHDKSFKLTYEGQVPADTTFHVTFTADGVPYDLPLAGSSSPFTSQKVELPDKAVIANVMWYATWTPAGMGSVDILLGQTKGETLTCDTVNKFTFGSQLDGYKWEDLNADGDKDAGEPGLPGWTIKLERQVGSSWVPYGSKVTNASGYYKFYSLLPGHYRATEDLAAMTDYAWVQSMPAAGYYEFDINALSTAGGASVACVGTKVSKNFMNWAPASLHALKFHDLNVNEERDDNEPGLPGWIVYVDYDNDGVRDASGPLGPEPYAMTDANGECTITGIHPGSFPVREEMVGGWNQSVGGSYVVQFVSRGEYGIEVPFVFGNWTTASKAGMKFHDLDADGVKDAGEPGLAGWTIYVDYNDDGIHDADEPSAVTGDTGAYIIWGINPGTWNVREVLTGDWVQSFPAEGYYSVDFTSSMEDTGNDFGNWEPAGIEGYKFNDLNVNGAYDQDEPRLSGWTIYVDYDEDGVLDANEPSAVTDGNGYYSIDGLTPGSYVVREVAQTDWTQSMGDHAVTLVSGQNAGTQGELDFGNWTTTGLSGYKFVDKDADGTWDGGEPVKSGVTINLMGTDVFLQPVMLQTITDANGYYEFMDLVPGDYVVSEVVPTDWTQSYPAEGTWDVTLYSGVMPEMSLDFGNWSFADPHGYKINDLNANGILEQGEPGLEGWTINLDGVTGWGETIHMDTLTDSEGRWEFTEVPPGTYTISETQMADWTQSFPDDPNTYTMTLESGEIPEEEFNFGNWTTATKYGMKFFDADGDGLPREEGEIGLAGWTIYVDYDGDGVHDANEPSDVTDATGAYMIEDIIPGTYYVREVNDSPDWMNTYPAAGYYYETFESSYGYRGNDFGNTTWVDKTFELTFETGVPADEFSVTFTTEFTKSTPPPIFDGPIEARAQAIAIIVEDHELPLVETEPGVYSAALPVWPQTFVKNVEWWATYGGEKIKLGDGVESELIDAPVINEFEYGAGVFGSKWNDTDFETGEPGDGIWDKVNESAMSGWTIELYRMNQAQQWVFYDSMQTAADGSYMFADVLPGIYYLGEIIPLNLEGDPTWIQTGGPMGVGGEEFEVSDDSLTGPVDFGNSELPDTPLTRDMGLTKDVSKSTANPNDTLTYTITWTMVAGGLNIGEPFTITDDFDEAHLTVVDAAGGTVSNGVITWNLVGPVYTGDSGTITYKLKVNEKMPTGVTNVDNTAVITVDADEDPSNNSDSERVTVTIASDGEPYLPFTGGEGLLLLGVLSMAVLSGLALRRHGRRAAA